MIRSYSGYLVHWSKRRASQGMAYLGFLLALAISGQIALWQVEQGDVVRQREIEEQLLAIGKEFRQALRSYQSVVIKDSTPQFPRSLSDLLRDPRQAGIVRHLRKIYADPTTGLAHWGVMRNAQGGIIAIYSLNQKLVVKTTAYPDELVYLQGRTNISEWQFAWGVGCSAERCDFPADTVRDTERY